MSLGLYFFNLEHGDAQACHSSIHLPPPTLPPSSSPPPRPTRLSSSSSTASSASTTTASKLGPSVSCVCGDAGVDNYGVDIMGAAESLAFEATFLLRRPSPPTPSSSSSLHRASSSLTSLGGLGRGLIEDDGDVLTFSPRFLPAGEEGARGGSRLFFSSLGYAALKSFGDVLMRVNKPQYGIEIYETCIIILDAHGTLLGFKKTCKPFKGSYVHTASQTMQTFKPIYKPCTSHATDQRNPDSDSNHHSLYPPSPPLLSRPCGGVSPASSRPGSGLRTRPRPRTRIEAQLRDPERRQDKAVQLGGGLFDRSPREPASG